MKCSQAHKKIHLFAELSEKERTQVNEHIKECHSCNELFESMALMNLVIRKAVPIEDEPTDSFQLTSLIMTKIKAITQQRTFTDRLFDYIELKQVKWAMTIISIFFVFLLVMEQIKPIQNPPSYTASLLATSPKIAAVSTTNYSNELIKAAKRDEAKIRFMKEYNKKKKIAAFYQELTNTDINTGYVPFYYSRSLSAVLQVENPTFHLRTLLNRCKKNSSPSHYDIACILQNLLALQQSK